MRIPIRQRVYLRSRRLTSRTRRWVSTPSRRLLLRCTCDRQGRPGPQRHLSVCGVHEVPYAYRFPRTQCRLLGHQPYQVALSSHGVTVELQRQGGWASGGVDHRTYGRVLDQWGTYCRVCGSTLDQQPWNATGKQAMGREGGTLSHLWIRVGALRDVLFRHVSEREL